MWKYIIIIIATTSAGKVKNTDIWIEKDRAKAFAAYELVKTIECDTLNVYIDSLNMELLCE